MAAGGVITGRVVLNLGIVSVILLGSYLIVNSQVSIFTLLIFLIASATVYSPLENGLTFLAEILMMDNKIERAKEIESLVVEGGMTEYELEKRCEQNPHCGCNCIKCELFAYYMTHNDDER